MDKAGHTIIAKCLPPGCCLVQVECLGGFWFTDSGRYWLSRRHNSCRGCSVEPGDLSSCSEVVLSVVVAGVSSGMCSAVVVYMWLCWVMRG